jgi:RND family efflux transporter MFP subunit
MRHQTLIFAALGVSATFLAYPLQAAESLAVTKAEYREVAQTYSVEGVVEAVRQSTVSAQIAGRVKEVNFDVGDTVKKGQIIVRIDERETAQALAGSQAQVMQSQAALTQAKASYERSVQLFEQKYISQSGLDKAKADYEMAKAQAAASEAGESQSALAHGYASVIAPFGGVVASRLVEMGEMVTVGKPLMVGFDPTQMRIIVNVPQDKLAEIGTHPKVSIELSALKRWVPAAAVTVQPSADIRTHSTQVRVSLPPRVKGVYPGMFVRAHFVVGKTSKLLIPSSAVVRRSEVVAVYVIDDTGSARLRQVRLGEETGENEVEVLVGLNPGEHVALDPIKAGMTINSSK